MEVKLVVILVVSAVIALFFGLATGSMEIPFTHAWEEQRKHDRAEQKMRIEAWNLKQQLQNNQYLYFAFSNYLTEMLNALADGTLFLNIKSSCMLYAPPASRMIFKRKSVDLTYHLHIGAPLGRIIDGKLATPPVDLEAIRQKIKKQFPKFLENTGWGYRELFVYLNDEGACCVTVCGVHFMPSPC